MKRKNTKFKELKSKVYFFGMNLIMLLMIECPVYAGEMGEPAIVSGTRKLAAAATGFLTGLVVVVGVVKASTVGMKWINASAEEKPKYQKELIQVIIAIVVTLTIGSTITYIVGFYGA